MVFSLSGKAVQAEYEADTPHIMRHTFCTRFCENETNVRVIQKIMGHSDISVTMGVYSHVTTDKAKECMESMEKNMKVL